MPTDERGGAVAATDRATPPAEDGLTAYEVFCRRSHDSEMERVGSINAHSPAAANAIAWFAYDGFAQVEMWLVPRASVIRQERPADVLDDRVLQTILRGRGSSRGGAAALRRHHAGD